MLKFSLTGGHFSTFELASKACVIKFKCVTSNNGMTQNRGWSCQTWHDLVTQGSNEGAVHCYKTPVQWCSVPKHTSGASSCTKMPLSQCSVGGEATTAAVASIWKEGRRHTHRAAHSGEKSAHAPWRSGCLLTANHYSHYRETPNTRSSPAF